MLEALKVGYRYRAASVLIVATIPIAEMEMVLPFTWALVNIIIEK